MLDTCILDERLFGLVLNDPSSLYVAGTAWTTGTLAHIEHHEAGSNHMLVVRGGERFDVVEAIEPALPPFSDPPWRLVGEDGFFLDQEALMARARARPGPSSAHISASVRIRPSSNLMRASTTVFNLVRSTMTIAGAMGIDDTAWPWVQSRIEEVEASGPDACSWPLPWCFPTLRAANLCWPVQRSGSRGRI